jgi:predicted glycogen debranching enzyme
MDARVDGRAITPRAGFPVEIEALWINGLGVATDLLTRVGEDVGSWSALRDRAVSSFGSHFPLGTDGLADALTPAGLAVTERRPNQLLAASLPHGPVTDPADVDRIVAACRADLVTSVGLRSLSPADPRYRGLHRGGPAERDAAYHQGTVWPWLIGPYIDAARLVGSPVDGLLDGLEAHLGDFGLGSVSETADGAQPHLATGCPFQAWSVAELLRVLSTRE